MFYFIPQSLINNPFFKNLKPIHLEKYFYFISLLTEIKIKNRRYDSSDFIHLKTVYLKNIITSKKCFEVIKNLLKWNIIERSNSYQVNNFSKSYRLKNELREEPLKKIKISQKILNRINKHTFENILDNESVNSNLEKIFAKSNYSDYFINKNIKEFNIFKNHLKNITIDYENAINYINSLNITQEKYNILKISIEKIHNKEFFIVNDKKSNRIYTNITSLFKPLRQFLRYNDKKLINVDIANSQPLLLNLFLNKKNPHKDILLYNNLTNSGVFYDYFYKEYIKKYKNVNMDIKSFKKLFFNRVLFCRPFMNFIYKESRLFQTLFPNVFDCLIDLKKKLNYKNFIFLLQKIESKLLIQRIGVKLSNTIPVFSIHDSIMTTEDNVDLIKNEINFVYKQYKLYPQLKIKSNVI